MANIDDVSNGEIYRAILEVKRQISELSLDLSDHSTRLAVLEDRSHGAGLWGGSVGGAVVAIFEAAKWALRK